MLCTLSFKKLTFFIFHAVLAENPKILLEAGKEEVWLSVNSELFLLLIYMHYLLCVIFTFSKDAQAVL